MNGAMPPAGNAPPSATPMKPEPASTVASARRFGAWHTKRRARRCSTAAPRVTTESGRRMIVRRDCASTQPAATSGTISVTQLTNGRRRRILAASASTMTSAMIASTRRWIVQLSILCQRVMVRVARRAAERRSSSQPIAIMPSETMNANGSSSRIGAAGTALETTTVMMLIGFQQFITAKPR